MGTPSTDVSAEMGEGTPTRARHGAQLPRKTACLKG
jgi:hypothetical protein